MEDQLAEAALAYHRYPTPGKITVQPTKDMTNQRDLSLAYSPGVAVPCLEIEKDPLTAYDYTSKGNLVAVISNGTAVLGLGNIGALAGKPVMEGKGCLFKKFAGIDVFDIEIDETDPDKLIEIIASLEPTFGGINLEDIKAPECFTIEQALRKRMKIPVFHDDQHGTAIVAAAALLNGLEVVGKRIEEIKLVCSGAGAAAIACLDIVVGLGVRKENVWITDSKGVVYAGRKEYMDDQKARYAQDTPARALGDIIADADVFFGLSAPGVLKPEMVKEMADRPIILAMANPEPEIRPELAKGVRPDAIIATGRSDYPNQVNNVLCFPFIFRGALDVGATTINEEMKLACVRALAELARAEQSDVVAAAYGKQEIRFGPEYLIPRPFDPRIITKVAPAVAQAAMDTGVATRPIADIEAYRRSLQRYVYTSGTVMQPVFAAAVEATRARIVYAEGEDDRVLRAAQVVLDENLAHPVLVGRPDVIAARIKDLGLRIEPGRDVEIASFDDAELVGEAAEAYYQFGKRKGVERELAASEMRRNGTLIAAMLLQPGQGRRPAVRHLRQLSQPPALCRRGDRAEAGGQHPGGHEPAPAPAPYRLHLRYLHQPRSDGGTGGRDDAAGRSRGSPLRPHATGGTGLALELRHRRRSVLGQDAAGAGADREAGSGARGRGRDARRRSPLQAHARSHVPGLAPDRRGEPAGLPDA